MIVGRLYPGESWLLEELITKTSGTFNHIKHNLTTDRIEMSLLRVLRWSIIDLRWSQACKHTN